MKFSKIIVSRHVEGYFKGVSKAEIQISFIMEVENEFFLNFSGKIKCKIQFFREFP